MFIFIILNFILLDYLNVHGVILSYTLECSMSNLNFEGFSFLPSLLQNYFSPNCVYISKPFSSRFFPSLKVYYLSPSQPTSTGFFFIYPPISFIFVVHFFLSFLYYPIPLSCTIYVPRNQPAFVPFYYFLASSIIFLGPFFYFFIFSNHFNKVYCVPPFQPTFSGGFFFFPPMSYNL
jgi:hypothetical protein